MQYRYLYLALFDPLALLSGHETDPEKLQLLRIIVILMVILAFFMGRELWKLIRTGKLQRVFSRLTRKVNLEVTLEKDKPLRPQVLTMTIKNNGNHDADLNAPVIEFRKIWTKRKFKVNGINGHQVYPLFLYPGNVHSLQIETATFHQYDRSIKSFYWARIYVSDSEGRQWKSNRVKLRKSLVT
ncbi:MAG TPA: hypothetical protein VFG54_04830 [Prolixibacteraceae bacterium]|nr:hypothetical protein [Prolixibacteraceae bacterium]